MLRTLCIGFVTVVALTATTARPALAFCGFYVTKADTELFNKASQVVLVRDGDRTVMTMANDFRGDPTDFAMVIPVPTVLDREQIHVGDMQLVDHLDAYSAPRLVEYFDENPCHLVLREAMDAARQSAAAPREENEARNRALGVAIEASYTVGEYDILILSARQSDGLETWLTENGYRIPPGASSVLGSYIRQGMRFFVARVNLEQQSALGYPWQGNDSCEAVAAYRQTLAQRHEQQAQTLASLTGRDIQEIRRKMGTDDLYPVPDTRSWWQRLWDR